MTKAPLDRDIYPLSLCSYSSNHCCYALHTACAYFNLPPVLSTDLSMLKPPRQWLDPLPLISLVALESLYVGHGPFWMPAYPRAGAPACSIDPRSSDINRSKTCFAFPPACYCITFVSFPTASFTPSSRTPLVHLGLDCSWVQRSNPVSCSTESLRFEVFESLYKHMNSHRRVQS